MIYRDISAQIIVTRVSSQLALLEKGVVLFLSVGFQLLLERLHSICLQKPWNILVDFHIRTSTGNYHGFLFLIFTKE